jgi:hypothetical protein
MPPSQSAIEARRLKSLSQQQQQLERICKRHLWQLMC